jgi:hypothetical protein
MGRMVKLYVKLYNFLVKRQIIQSSKLLHTTFTYKLYFALSLPPTYSPTPVIKLILCIILNISWLMS